MKHFIKSIAMFCLGAVTMASCGDEPTPEKQGEEVKLEVSKTELGFAQNADSKVVSITTTGVWYVENNSDWITVSPMGGKGNGAIIVSVSQNASGQARESYFSVSIDSDSKVVIVSQSATDTPAEENNGGGSSVNGGNNNSGNNGTASGDILPKKVTKIVETWEDSEYGTQTKTYFFDSEGRITKCYREGESYYNYTFEYTENSIKFIESEYFTNFFNIESGRITSRTNKNGERKCEYGYSPEGYLISRGKEKYTVENGLITRDSYWESDGNSTEYNWEGKFTYGSNLNNLNVDLFLLFLEIDEDAVFTGLYGNRINLLPTLVEATDYYTKNGVKGEEEHERMEFIYEYSGEYITKIKLKEIDEGETVETVYEIFY